MLSGFQLALGASPPPWLRDASQASVLLSMQAATRLRCDPTEYARKQQEKRDRATELRTQRQKGFVSEDHTFAPKVNPKPRAESSSREEAERAPPRLSNPMDDMPIRPSKSLPAGRGEEAPLRASKAPASYSRPPNNNNHEDAHGSDALDSLARRYPKRQPSEKHEPLGSPTPLEPEHDSLFREVKRTTGRELDDLPIRRSAAPTAGKHTGPCLRNSSCGCPQCGGGVAMSSSSSRGALPDPPIRRREIKPAPAMDDPYACQSNSARPSVNAKEMESSLLLLKSKMSRRKSQSAPTKQSSLFLEKNSSTGASSARNPPMRAPPMEPQQQGSPPPRAVAPAPRRAPPARAAPPPAAKPATRHVQEEDDSDVRYPPPISTGFNHSEAIDEYPDGSEEMEQCGNCRRRFNLSALEKHERICAKVFTEQRKTFNMTAKRLEGTEAEQLLKKNKSAGGGKSGSGGGSKRAEDQAIKAAKAADWKAKSDMFREAMKASRNVTVALKNGTPLPPVKPSAPDPSLIQCEFCSRRFNERAAERHITFCKEKSQRDNVGRGPPKKAAAPPPKPARAAPAKKR